ncbi:HAD family hydrolase [Halorussus lipolyticus]|uniref:HAD family hydrolase n=1 Tax=Halorussus lipolyticus TaxID=3034024 RepID=UPI0023E78413|nr:HAD family hydrolase [Halorussus sp. DT80]
MRAVFFDLDGTLIDLPEDFFAVFEQALTRHDVRADAERHERFTETLLDLLGECRADPYRDAMADLCAEFGLDADPDELAESYVEREVAATALRPGTNEVFDALGGSAETALGVLTNGGARAQRRKLARHGLAEEFDAVVVSGEVGAGKPDPEIFATATEAIPADEYVFVADDLERDVLPAQESGFTGVYLSEAKESAELSEATDRADETASSLREVPALLG